MGSIPQALRVGVPPGRWGSGNSARYCLWHEKQNCDTQGDAWDVVQDCHTQGDACDACAATTVEGCGAGLPHSGAMGAEPCRMGPPAPADSGRKSRGGCKCAVAMRGGESGASVPQKSLGQMVRRRR